MGADALGKGSFLQNCIGPSKPATVLEVTSFKVQLAGGICPLIM